MTASDRTKRRLTQFSHGGGCGCKIAPRVLQQILAGSMDAATTPELLVGAETSDDGAVYRINDSQAIISTTDFFMPIVDDPYDFGAIAATNALSDVYAMGGTPLFALAIVAMPVNDLPVETIRRVVAGGEAACARAGIPIAGGHTIDSVEPIYGLAVTGVAHPEHIKRNSAAQPGDAIVLGKPLGVGIYSAALKKEALPPDAYAELVELTTMLNTPGIDLGRLPGVHAMTDVTGFGLLGHLLEICRGSNVGATIEFERIPMLQHAVQLARQGCVTGASARNLDSYAVDVSLAERLGATERALLCDPQTSGGLLVTCAPDDAPSVVNTFHRKGFAQATTIGVIAEGAPAMTVR